MRVCVQAGGRSVFTYNLMLPLLVPSSRELMNKSIPVRHEVIMDDDGDAY